MNLFVLKQFFSLIRNRNCIICIVSEEKSSDKTVDMISDNKGGFDPKYRLHNSFSISSIPS